MYIMIVGTCEIIMNFIEFINPGWNEDETRTVKRAVRVDESLSSFFDFLVFASCFHASFSSFFDACQTADSPSHYANCHLSIIRNNIFLFSSSLLMCNDLEIACFCNSLRLSCNFHDRSNEPKFEPAQSWWECMRVDESWRSNESESCDSHPRLINP